MPKYLVERQLGGPISDEDLREAVARSKEVMAQMSEMQWLHSNMTADRSTIVCEYIAPNPESIQEHSRRANLPCTRITEVTEFDAKSFK
ncbi:DUF4242 domain-containing protein [Kyrpidia tusciae]|uniref:DUF4242 domain-containing protein n=1 Tax=Kyrpidia tusciae (strain DSM 2912 / NBRC 15312 / T2) TaxID=562970 RepID=D5WPK0_KYRT2|nr:DUF4242 domain-containing protein [Kyrpidia tusciae]ADG06259.1 conserved hypothetical protein [Kyrpidia tusciae DSM 2912]MBE3553084.1 DUF4242 domain-containing protein [Kyrpidia tusciae]